MSLTVDVAKAAANAMLPPRNGAGDDELYRWRLIVAGAIIFMAGALTTHIALACGYMTILFPGFAVASDVGDVKQQIIAMRSDTLRGQIVEAVKDQCAAHDQKNYTAERAATDRKYVRIDEYRKVTGQQPDVPQCWEVP